MARYCFYCGRELHKGEKCDCRYEAAQRTAQDAKSSSKRASARTDKAGKKASFFGKNKDASSAKAQGTSKKRQGTARTNRATGKRARPSTRPGKASGTKIGKILLQYFLHPVEQIRLTAQAKTQQPTLSLLFIQSFVAGLLLLYATEHPFLRMVFGLNIVSAQQAGTAISRVFLLFQGMGIFLSAYLLHALLYHLLLRYVFRQAIAYTHLLSGLCGSCFYATLFLLSGLFLMAGSFFSALFLAALAFAFSLIAHTIALRFITSLDESRVFMLVALAAFAFVGLIAMLFSLSLPVLSALLEQSIII